ncbi:tRNA (adenosine(37)-N6)-threonylcarbamoyltransferase complex dimerization subunit type 1 TsaB [Candidatus Dojkabacteria bacterium]|nr:tRNA (adenosine(37)-N6)-threonylcarbamoyltransferase complex dimerization subunit type 1 TsaB [Candidatus Dojkabacteria bacterium]
MKYILGIQTAELPNEVALLEFSKSKVEIPRKFTKKISTGGQTIEELGDSVKKILAEAGIEPEEVDLVCVCLGPGSYTGTRGGVAFAKGYCQFRGIPLIGVSAFEVLEESIKTIKGIGNVVFMLDAKNERVFALKSDRKSFGKIRMDQVRVDSIENILTPTKERTLFLGSGAAAYRGIINEEIKNRAAFVPAKSNILRAVNVAARGLKSYQKNSSIYSKDYLLNIKPLYILPPNITKAKSK